MTVLTPRCINSIVDFAFFNNIIYRMFYVNSQSEDYTAIIHKNWPQVHFYILGEQCKAGKAGNMGQLNPMENILFY